MTAPAKNSIAAMAREFAATLPAETETIDASRFAWLLLVPVWPEKLAHRGIPGSQRGSDTDVDVVDFLRSAVEAGVLHSAQGEPPWRDNWYWMNSVRGARMRDELLESTDGGLELFHGELTNLAWYLADIPEQEMPPALRKFREIIFHAGVDEPPVVNESMAQIVNSRVLEELKAAKGRNDSGCPEAQRWIEVAAPLADIFGGALSLSVERARRRVELFERRGRDRRFLEHYTSREKLQQAFVDLLDDSADESWALHYLGDGGMGKTMLIRHITGPLAEDRRLVTSRVDFDHINPDYPSRAPGLLLVALAEDLKLHEDSSVVEHLIRFDSVIAEAQIKVEEALHSGTELDIDVQERLDEAEMLFVDALRSIRTPSRVVLILDTCEELARIRSNGELSNAVVKTFELLTRLHDEIPSLRVVFSGRRNLASGGFGDWKGEEGLPPRPYLRRAVVKGFTHGETERFFDGYARGQRPVASKLRDKVRALSIIGRDDAPPETALFNPFDLNLYAGWLSDPNVDADAVHLAGKHHYVRERIVRPLNEWVRPFVPYLAKLGDFDRDLVRAVADLSDDDCETALKEIVAQEWVERAVAAQWQKDEFGQQSQSSWRIEPNVARRLVQYYSAADEQRAAWEAVQKKLRKILPALVLARPWRELSVEYFAVAFELMAPTPEGAFAWWRRVERKILVDRAWQWGRDILSAIRGREWAPDSPMHGLGDTGLIVAMLAATEVALQTKLKFEGSALQSAWSSVRNASRGQESPGCARLFYRASAGVTSSRRWFDTPMSESYVGELENMLDAVPPMPALSPLPPDEGDDELLATELGLLDNAIEILDQIEWREAVQRSLVGKIEGRIHELRPKLPPWMAAFLDCRLTRLDFLANLPTRSPGFEYANLSTVQRPERTEYLDWTAPANLPMRLILEIARTSRWLAAEPSHHPLIDLLKDRPLEDIDAERALSMVLRVESDRRPVPIPMEHFERALTLAQEKPTCEAHREAAPLFQTMLELMADQGDGASALRFAEGIAQDSARPFAVRRCAERVKVFIAAKWRLTQMGIARQTSLSSSNSLEDRLLLAGAEAFESESPAYQGRWRASIEKLTAEGARQSGPKDRVEEAHLQLDELETASAGQRPVSRRDRPPHHFTFSYSTQGVAALLRGWALGRHDLPRVSCGLRLAASIAVEEAGLLALRSPEQALRLLAFAIGHFNEQRDHVGALLASAARALILAGLRRPTPRGDAEQAMRELEEAVKNCDAERRVRRSMIWDMAPELAAGQRAIDLKTPEGFWQAWAIRVAIAKVFANLPAHVGAPVVGTDEVTAPPDIRWIFAISPQAEQTRSRAVAPAAASPPRPKSMAQAAPQPGLATSGAEKPEWRTWFFWRSRLAGAFQRVVLVLLVTWIVGSLNDIHFRGDDAPPGLLGGAGPSWLPPALALMFGIVVAAAMHFQNSPRLGAGRTWGWKVLRASITFVVMLFAIAFLVAGSVYLFRGFDWLLTRAGIEMQTSWKWGALIAILALLGAVPAIFRATTRLLEKLFRLHYEVLKSEPSGHWQVRFSVTIRWLPISSPPTMLSPPYEIGSFRMVTYASQRLSLGEPQQRFYENGFVRTMLRVFKVRFNADINVPNQLAEFPWEAMLTRTPVQRICRSAEPWPNYLLAAMRQPIDAPVRIISVAKTRASVSAQDAWARSIAGNSRLELLRGGYAQRASALPPESEKIRVLHVLDEVRETSRGLTIEPGDGRQLFAAELMRAFPFLRVVILQLPHRDSGRRVDRDRVEAKRARELAAQLFAAGVPAIVVLPSLTESVALAALKRISDAIARCPADAKIALMYAVSAAQDEARVGLTSQAKAADAADAEAFELALAETPFDFCLYCAPDLSLAVNPGARK